jgi:hypothetical protein
VVLSDRVLEEVGTDETNRLHAVPPPRSRPSEYARIVRIDTTGLPLFGHPDSRGRGEGDGATEYSSLPLDLLRESASRYSRVPSAPRSWTVTIVTFALSAVRTTVAQLAPTLD